MQLLLMGVRHYNFKDRVLILSYIKKIKKIEDCIFLLECDVKRSKNKESEFYYFTRILKGRKVPFKYIDTAALKLKEDLLEKIKLPELIELSLRKKNLNTIKTTSFYKFLIEKREKYMVKRILDIVKTDKYKRIVILVGKDHEANMYKDLRTRLKNVKSTYIRIKRVS